MQKKKIAFKLITKKRGRLEMCTNMKRISFKSFCVFFDFTVKRNK